MDKSEIKVVIAGEGVRPETVDVKDLIDFLSTLEKSVVAALPGGRTDQPALMSLIAIQEGNSSDMLLALAPEAVKPMRAITTAIATRQYASLPLASQNAIYAMYRKTREKNWGIKFLPTQSNHFTPAVISEDFPVPAPSKRLALGATTIFGECLRAGGANDPTVVIRMNNGMLMYCSASRADAKELARHLYESVALEGKAIWDPENNWRLEAFTITRLVSYKPTNLIDAFTGLAEVANGTWKEIDAAEFVRMLRAGDEE